MKIQEGIEAFKLFYLRQGYSLKTIETYVPFVKNLSHFLEKRGIDSWSQFTPALARIYKLECQDLPSKARLGSLRRMGDFLLSEGIVSQNPSLGLKADTEILTKEEVERITGACDLTSRLGIRDHALFELLYYGAMSFEEGIKLKTQDLKDSSITISRTSFHLLIPLPESTTASLERYLRVVRPHFLRLYTDSPYLFLTVSGDPLSPRSWGKISGKYLKESGVQKSLYPHSSKWARLKELLRSGVDREELKVLSGYRSESSFRSLLRKL